MHTVTSYSEWERRCKERGWSGPHRISGTPVGTYQFTKEGEGTVAIWNAQAQKGVILIEIVPDAS